MFWGYNTWEITENNQVTFKIYHRHSSSSSEELQQMTEELKMDVQK